MQLQAGALAQVLPCEFCKFSKGNFLTEQLREAASEISHFHLFLV